MAQPLSLHVNDVKNVFEDNGYLLLSDITTVGNYINGSTKLKCECKICHLIKSITYNHLQSMLKRKEMGRESKCRNCIKLSLVKISCPKKETYEEVKENLLKEGYILISKEYLGSDKKIKYKCPNGHERSVRYSDFKQGNRCLKCSYEEKKITGKSKEIRDKYKQTCLNKFGVEHSSQSQKVKNKSKETHLKNHGVEHSSQSPKIKEKRKQTFLKKYGVEHMLQIPASKEKRLKTIKDRGTYGSGYSKESQALFWKIYNRLPKEFQEECYFAENRKEIGISYKEKFYKYDFVCRISKTIIEYQGSVWHPRPELSDDTIGWHATEKQKTAKEFREYEKIKFEAMQSKGYLILEIWDYEMHGNPKDSIEKCIEFIKRPSCDIIVRKIDLNKPKIKKKHKTKETIEKIAEIFLINGRKLLITEYFGTKKNLKFECMKCNKICIATYGNIKKIKGYGCATCASRQKFEQNIKNHLEKENCKLLHAFNQKKEIKINYICSCGTEITTYYALFKRGDGCKQCKITK